MRLQVGAVFGVLMAASLCLAQANPDEAVAKLKAKQAAKDAERAKIVQISAGELQDLRDQIRLLQTQNAEFQKKLADLGAAAKAPPKKRFTQIEIGMTKAEVTAFIAAHKDLKLIGIAANNGKSKQAFETVTRNEGAGQNTVVRNGGAPDTTAVASSGQNKRVVEQSSSSGKHETLTIGRMGTRSVVTGQTTNVLGQSEPVYGRENVQVGTIKVTMVDEVVTAIAAD